MYISVITQIEHEPVGWSIGYCKACECEGAVVIERVKEVTYVSGFQTGAIHRGNAARCDFCQRQVELPADPTFLPFGSWSHGEGLAKLYVKLDIPIPVGFAEPMEATRLHALLSQVQKRVSTKKIEVGFVGLGVGSLVGGLLAFLAVYLYSHYVEMNRYSAIPAYALLGGILVGLIVGAFIELSWTRVSKAVAHIETTSRNYGTDLMVLKDVSGDYNRTIRKAVAAVCKKYPLSSPKKKTP